ncbi:hypothetical protein Agabi119p4_8466 [Agaricus bisporus var. burnettii]|uniref:Uncharacterized protein n=1 Tax=Agaricus bisporus var. burnettii TaxID=192524 RepID=A0A8H7C754_AGABI|nr:hypothetical protein Agabi119p4_8466 [Agaricus bisporus var. burnettii]
MSSDSNNSSTGTANSSKFDEEPESISQLAEIILANLSTSITVKLPVTELDIDPANSPQLENIRVQTSGIPYDTYQALTDLLHLVRCHCSELMELRSKALNNEPILHREFKDHGELLKNEGIAIINGLHRAISQHIRLVEQTCGELMYTKIQEVIEEQPEQGLTLEERLRALGISDDVWQDLQMAIKIMSRLKEYLHAHVAAEKWWQYACETIYSIEEFSKAPATVTAPQIHSTKEKILQLISPIVEYTTISSKRYGHEIMIMQKVNYFCVTIPNIIEDIERIFAAKQIIKRGQKTSFSKATYYLGLATFKYLESIKDAFDQSPADAIEFVGTSVGFRAKATALCEGLSDILNKWTSSRKSGKAEKNRMTGLKGMTSPSNSRALVDPSEVQLILLGLERNIDMVHQLMISLCYESINVQSTLMDIKEVEKRSLRIKLDLSHDLCRRVHQVLEENVDADGNVIETNSAIL